MWGQWIHPVDRWSAEKIGLKGSLTRPALEAYQLAQLRQMLRYVKAQSRFYQAALAAVQPDDLRCLADLRRLPFTTPEQLAADPTAFFCATAPSIARIVSLTTSGSTGPAKRIAATPADLEQTIDYFHHGMLLLADSRDTVLNLFPAERPDSLGDLLHRAIERVPCRVLSPTFITPAESAEVVLREQVTVLAGLPDWVAAIAEACRPKAIGRLGGPGRTVTSVLLSADHVSPKHLRQIAQAWPDCNIFEHYGMTEMGFGGAVSCGYGSGYHIRETDLLIELIDPTTLEVVPDGEPGEIVYTALNREGTPLIRYRTGDLSRRLTSPCPCGSVLSRLDRVGPRSVPKKHRPQTNV